jgi:hypothetical protein
MRVDVDESRRDDLSFRIDSPTSLARVDSPYIRNVAILNSNVCSKPGIAGAINNSAVNNRDVIGRRG